MEKSVVRKWWWGWQYEMIEAWLEEKASKGYKLEKVTGSGEIFHFTKADNKKMRYCVDYQPKLSSEYKQILEDDGWSYMSIPGSWIICWKEYDDVRPELFNDYDSIINRNNKILTLLTCLVFPALFMYTFINNISEHTLFVIPVLVLYMTLIVFYVFAIAGITSANKALKLKKDMQNK